jgi:hypothetical protein
MDGPEVKAYLLRGSTHWDVRSQEMPHPIYRALLQLFRLLPRIDRDLGVRRQGGNIDRGLQRVPWYVIWKHKHRRLAVPDEIA